MPEKKQTEEKTEVPEKIAEETAKSGEEIATEDGSLSDKSECDEKSEEFKGPAPIEGTESANVGYTQDSASVVITIEFNEPVVYRDLEVKHSVEHISVQYKGETVLEGDLFEEIEGATWIVDDCAVIVTLSKQIEKIWGTLLKNGKSLQYSLAEAENFHMSNLDPESRKIIAEMMKSNKMGGNPGEQLPEEDMPEEPEEPEVEEVDEEEADEKEASEKETAEES